MMLTLGALRRRFQQSDRHHQGDHTVVRAEVDALAFRCDVDSVLLQQGDEAGLRLRVVGVHRHPDLAVLAESVVQGGLLLWDPRLVGKAEPPRRLPLFRRPCRRCRSRPGSVPCPGGGRRLLSRAGGIPGVRSVDSVQVPSWLAHGAVSNEEIPGVLFRPGRSCPRTLRGISAIPGRSSRRAPGGGSWDAAVSGLKSAQNGQDFGVDVVRVSARVRSDYGRRLCCGSGSSAASRFGSEVVGCAGVGR